MTDLPRPPAMAGTFYAPSGAELAHQLERCFLDPRGPGALPTPHRAPTRTLRAAVVPHAGLDFSGPIAAHVYALLAAQKPPESVLLLGVDHQGLGAGPSLSDRAWLTPLGPMETDHALVRALAHGPVKIDEEAQAESIDRDPASVPRVRPPAPPVPRPPEPVRPLRAPVGGRPGRDRGHPRRDVLLDRLHGLLPLRAASDRGTARPARDRRYPRPGPANADQTVERNDISMCGIAPTTVLLAALAEEPLVARLLRWGHSGEVQPMREVVGYAALALETPPGGPPPR